MRSNIYLKAYFFFTLIISLVILVITVKHTMFFFHIQQEFYDKQRDIARFGFPIDFPRAMSMIFDLLLTVTLPIILIWIPYGIIIYRRFRKSKLA